MTDMGCDGWNDFGGPECNEMPPPPEFVRAPPHFLCDLAFGDEYTCSNDSPFPFHNADGISINADGTSPESMDATFLAVAVVCAVIFTVLLTTSGVFMWRNRKHLRKYLTCRSRSPTESRKGATSSATSTSDGSSDATAYSDNIEYKKKALLATISPPTGVKFLTDSAIRYAPSASTTTTTTVLDGPQSQHSHIYEEIANNYPIGTFCHPGARYAVFRDVTGVPLSQQAFAQRQSWLDYLQRPPCPDMVFNLYDDGTKTAAACPNCYYPSLPRDCTARHVHGGGTLSERTGHVLVNPVEEFDHGTGHRRNRRHGAAGMTAPYPFGGMHDPEHYQTTEALMSSTIIRNQFPSSRQNFHVQQHHTNSMDAHARTQTIDPTGYRQSRTRKRAKCSDRSHPVLQTFNTSQQAFTTSEQQNTPFPEHITHGASDCI